MTTADPETRARGGLGLLAAITILTSSGCYLAHERATAPDAATTTDAGPLVCRRVSAVATALLDEGVTPRVVALSGGDVGVVYVRVDGDPTRVVYERLGPSLARVTGAVTVATDSFTWAEIETIDDQVLVAYGLAGDRASALVHLSTDGALLGERESVPLLHPSIFDVAADGAILWAGFDSHDDNALVLSHVTRAGVPIHPPVTIPLGRYGSGHHALARDDGSHVLGYPSEGPPGARHGHVSAIAADGTLAPDRMLDPMDADRAVTPVRLDDGLVIVRETDAALVVERTDERSLERGDRTSFPPVDGAVIAAAVGGHLVVAHTADGLLRWELFASDLSIASEGEIAMPLPGIGGSSSVAALPGALVVALGLVDGPHAAPWLVRLECAP